MPVLPQDLQAGELTSVESGFYGEDEDDEPKTEEKAEDVLDLTKAQKAKQLFRMKQRNNQIKQRGIL